MRRFNLPSVQSAGTVLSTLLWLGGTGVVANGLIRIGSPVASGRIGSFLFLFLLTAPLLYRQLDNRWHYTRRQLYFLFPVDIIIPFCLYVSLMILLFALPRFLLWGFGEVAWGELTAVQITQQLDPEFGLSSRTCATYGYAVDDQRYTGNSCSGGRRLSEVSAGTQLDVYYAPFAPRLSTVGLPTLFYWQDLLLVWWSLVIAVWLVGAAVLTPNRYPPAPRPAPRTAQERLARYGLDTKLSAADDPELWAAVLESLFRLPDDPKIHVPGLRFGVAAIHPNSRYLLQPIWGTCFERVDRDFVKPTPCAAVQRSDHHVDPELAPIVPFPLLHIARLPHPLKPAFSIVVPRPSTDESTLPVYIASNHPGAAATGATTYWERQANGSWRKTKNRVNWWYEG